MPELLGFCARLESLAPLCEALGELGMTVDTATDLAELRCAFFRRGGHDVLILAPDLPPHLAKTAAESLLGIDQDLRVVAFGNELGRVELPVQVTRLSAHHPSTPAGLGALLRSLRM